MMFNMGIFTENNIAYPFLDYLGVLPDYIDMNCSDTQI